MVTARFDFPTDQPVSFAQLERALAAESLVVIETSGEPPMERRVVRPTTGRASLMNGPRATTNTFAYVRLSIKADAAIRAFMSAQADSVTLGWCQSGTLAPFVSVPLERSPFARRAA